MMTAFQKNLLLTLAFAVFLTLVATRATQLAVEPVAQSEAAIKASYIVNFAKFIDWPGSAFQGPDSPLIITTVGADLIADELDRALRGKAIENRQVVIRREKKLANAGKSHLVFIGGSGSSTAGLESIQGPILTIGESREFISQGGEIVLFFDNSNIKFEINAKAIQKKGMQVSSKLLALARKVW